MTKCILSVIFSLIRLLTIMKPWNKRPNRGKATRQPAKPPTKVMAKPAATLQLSDDYRSSVCAASYLGKKGYTIPRAVLTAEDLEFLHTDLFVKPETFGPQYGGAAGADAVQAFPVYRENAKKIYVPRFYGIARYGMPPRSELSPGDAIDLEFAKPIRDYQEQIIQVYMNHVRSDQIQKEDDQGNGGILEVPCGRGKCLGRDTPILMWDGTIKPVQDIVVGDQLMGDNSTPRTVLSLARGREKMYRVREPTYITNQYKTSISYKPNVGYIVNESHILSLRQAHCPSTASQEDIEKYLTFDISVQDYLALSNDAKADTVGYRVPITFPSQPIDVDPYLVGYCLGKLPLGPDDDSDRRQWIDFVKKYDIMQNVHIPALYKCNARNIQIQVLSGILDTAGHWSAGGYIIQIQGRKTFLEDVTFLARSIGLVVLDIDHESIQICGKALVDVPTLLPPIATPSRVNLDLTYPICLDPLGEDDYYGFEIDGNRRFVLGDFTVTHNTVMALKIVSLLQKKTLILVHKEFLMNQWIERIQEFLPGASIGRIQGPTLDIQGRDIVLGMIQTLYDRDFPDDTFHSFGLTIVDEVHRIGSEQFSKTLLRVITPYMLGISATVDRKDKLTKILYMFIGDKIYTEKRADEDPVCVRAVEYISPDPEFNETELDFRGHPKYSTMISKISEFGPRRDFIVRILADLLEESPEAQIMVLCHTRALLTYFSEAIAHRGFASAGFYVGGMKQCDLQETEGKQIVLATYAMAAEALDIKTLSILVMASPKTDITQSVGRILRVRHENPIIVDIVDRHDVFQNQWRQRKTFYRKCNYRIRSIDSVRYRGMNLDWKTDSTWKRVFDPAQRVYDPACKNPSNGGISCSGVDDDDDGPVASNNPLLQRKCLIAMEDLDPLDM